MDTETINSNLTLWGMADRARAVLRGDITSTRGKSAWVQLILLVTVFSATYGAVMGAAGTGDGRWLQILYSALKVPLLLGATFALSVPSFFVFYSLAGLRNSFGRAICAVTAAQAGLAISLASLSPFTALWYASSKDYSERILFNGFMFAVATIAGQALIRQFYSHLIAEDRRHRLLLRTWLFVYSFVGIQMGWLLRPFVGHPGLETHFLRREMMSGNAYVIVARLIWGFFR